MSKVYTVKDAEDLFIYAYAVVTSEILSRGSVAERYSIRHGRSFVKAEDRDKFNIVRPNNDNLYSACWTQLENSPYILEIPAVEGRYILVNYLDMKTDIPFSVGSKNEGGSEGKYILLYRDAEVPAGYEDYTVVRAEDSRNNLLVRLEAFDESDYEAANRIQDSIVFKALYPERLKDRGEAIIGLSTVVIEKMSTDEFYKVFTESFDDSRIDDEYIELLKGFGVDVSTGSFDGVSAENRNLLEQGRKNGYAKITQYATDKLVQSKGWSYTVGNGNYGTDYLHRARVAYFGYGANLAEDSIYPAFPGFPDGTPLFSNKRYKIHFEKDRLPEAEFFWSITLYGLPSQYLTENELDRYMINSHEKNLFVNSDGSVDILLQNKRPEDEKLLPNWLPTPSDEEYFDITMRIYGPTKDQLEGRWEGPEVIEY